MSPVPAAGGILMALHASMFSHGGYQEAMSSRPPFSNAILFAVVLGLLALFAVNLSQAFNADNYVGVVAWGALISATLTFLFGKRR